MSSEDARLGWIFTRQSFAYAKFLITLQGGWVSFKRVYSWHRLSQVSKPNPNRSGLDYSNPTHRRHTSYVTHVSGRYVKPTLPGFEPGIPWFVVRCLIRWATRPSLTLGTIQNSTYEQDRGLVASRKYFMNAWNEVLNLAKFRVFSLSKLGPSISKNDKNRQCFGLYTFSGSCPNGKHTQFSDLMAMQSKRDT